MSIGVAQIMSYYPKYIYLDKVLEITGKNKLVLHIDLKNSLRSLYLEPFVKDIVRETQMSRHMDVSIFASFLEFISFHKQYAKKRGIDLEMYFFYEKGTSVYHEKYNKNYKGSRKINDLFNLGESYTELFYKVVSKNLDLIEKVGNKLPGCSVLFLDFLEADFMPYYLINRALPNPENNAHLIYSNDKDHYQILQNNFTFQFIKGWKDSKIIGTGDVWNQMLKHNLPHDPSYIPIFHAILGDDGDDIPGVKGVGPKTLIKIADELIQLLGPMEKVYKNLEEGFSIFDPKYVTNTKAVQTIRRNEKQFISSLYQVSYFLISEFFDSNSNTEIMKKRARILEAIKPDRPRIRNGNVLYEAFEKSGISVPVNEQSVFNLFQ